MIDFTQFEDKTRGGFAWHVVVAEDGLICVEALRLPGCTHRMYVLVREDGSATSLQDALVDRDALSLVLKKADIEWRVGWTPELDARFWDASWSDAQAFRWTSNARQVFRASLGLCYPDTPRGRALCKARARYEPRIAEIMALDDPAAAFAYLRKLNDGASALTLPFPRSSGLEELASSRKDHPEALRAAVRWLDSGYRLTEEEALPADGYNSIRRANCGRWSNDF